MWWFLKKIEDNNDFVVYAYGFETKEVSGRIRFDKKNNSGKVESAANNDSVKAATLFLMPHVFGVVNNENCPDERMIACG